MNETLRKTPCPICGDTQFQWFKPADSYMRDIWLSENYKTPLARMLQKNKTPILARHCSKCGNIVLFSESKKLEAVPSNSSWRIIGAFLMFLISVIIFAMPPFMLTALLGFDIPRIVEPIAGTIFFLLAFLILFFPKE